MESHMIKKKYAPLLYKVDNAIYYAPIDNWVIYSCQFPIPIQLLMNHNTQQSHSFHFNTKQQAKSASLAKAMVGRPSSTKQILIHTIAVIQLLIKGPSLD